ncbi:Thioesterase/thiol ester dehydrase-isomerase, partial [Caulochytrium protostelioides]
LEKRMRDSYVEEIIPFRSEPVIKEDYVNVFGRIRMGKILEDLDALSGSIAYLHCDDNMTNTSPFKIVTASLDRLDLLQDIPPDEDVRMSGMVTYVGTSSMEISIMMETMDPAHSRSAGAAGAADADGTPGSHAVDPIPPDAFTMVALDSETGRPATVNRLLLETPEERRIARIGQMHKKRKQELAQRKTTQALTESEMRDLHAVLAHPPRDDPSAIWMGDTEVQSLTLTYPQNRNIHSNIFGGYLMRRAFELGYANALMALKVPRVYFTALDDITFNAPVPIGCLLNLTSHIVYAPGGGSHTLQCTVRA